MHEQSIPYVTIWIYVGIKILSMKNVLIYSNSHTIEMNDDMHERHDHGTNLTLCAYGTN